MKEAALREVEEECGVKIFKNKEKLCRTYHIYEMNNKVVLKKTNWYNMTVKGSPKLIPQREEGITIGGDVNLDHFWYFNDLDGDSSYRVGDYGTTSYVRSWIRNNISGIL